MLKSIAFILIYLNISFADVRMRDSVYTIRHYQVQVDSNGMYESGPTNKIDSTKYPVKIVENDWIKLVLLPGHGGRVMSVYNKSTGHEQLYQSKIAAPFNVKGFRVFYYDYLYIAGGIFPSFPDGTHGRTWNQPWDFSVIKDTKDEAVLEMSYLDDQLDFPEEKIKYVMQWTGKSFIQCTIRITLKKGEGCFKYSIHLENTGDNSSVYEYWTSNVLAPGSDPGNTVASKSSEIIIPSDKIQIRTSAWKWMDSVDQRVDATQEIPSIESGPVFKVNKLAHYSNWKNMGTGYAYPHANQNWSGVLNHEKQEGFLRIADNINITKGSKVWTWGIHSAKVDVKDHTNPLRPFIELWSGITREFFLRDILPSKAVKTWDEYYYPFVGLQKVDYANEYGALSYEIFSEEKDKKFLELKFSAVHPNQKYKAEFKLNKSVTSVEATSGKDGFTSFIFPLDAINAKDASGISFRIYANSNVIVDFVIP